jgi:hypothetical protein
VSMTVVLVGWKSYASKDDEQDGDGDRNGVDGILCKDSNGQG